MRKLLIVLAVVFTTSIFMSAGIDAARYTSKSTTVKSYKAKRAHKYMKSSYAKKKYAVARRARGPVCVKKKAVRRHAYAKAARGPICPAPIVNVPQQPAPVVNVPQQPAPVVNIPEAPTPVGVAADGNLIYVVRGNQLVIIDRCTYQVKQTVQLP